MFAVVERVGSKWLTGVFGFRRYLVTKDDSALTHHDNMFKSDETLQHNTAQPMYFMKLYLH